MQSPLSIGKKIEKVVIPHNYLDCYVSNNTNLANQNIKIDGVELKSTFLKHKQAILCEGKAKINREIILSYLAESNSDHFFLLYFKSNHKLNVRINAWLSFDEQILDKQAITGTLFWSSKVGIEVMIPKNSQIEFQIIATTQNDFNSYLSSLPKVLLNKRGHFLHFDSPFFYFSDKLEKTHDFNLLIDGRNPFKPTDNFLISTIISYLYIDFELWDNSYTPWEFYTILQIEKKLSHIPLGTKLSLNNLAVDCDIPNFNFSKIFYILFGMDINEYHRQIHMEYAKWLLETQNLSVTKVGEALGYKSGKQFSQAFKKHFYACPNLYRPKSVWTWNGHTLMGGN